jgi:hypothetical protein
MVLRQSQPQSKLRRCLNRTAFLQDQAVSVAGDQHIRRGGVHRDEDGRIAPVVGNRSGVTIDLCHFGPQYPLPEERFDTPVVPTQKAPDFLVSEDPGNINELVVRRGEPQGVDLSGSDNLLGNTVWTGQPGHQGTGFSATVIAGPGHKA